MEIQQEYIEDHRLEIERRIRNLYWTISGDYSLNLNAGVELFAQSKYLALYDAIIQGAFICYHDNQALGIYLMQKIYSGGKRELLVHLVKIAMDFAVYDTLKNERQGIREIKKYAAEDRLKQIDGKTNLSYLEMCEKALIQCFLGIAQEDGEAEGLIHEMEQLRNQPDIQIFIEIIDRVYNTYLDPNFEKQHGTLSKVRKIPFSDLEKSVWEDCYSDELMAEIIKKFLDSQTQEHFSLEIDTSSGRYVPGNGMMYQSKAVEAKAKTLEEQRKVREYLELNYGRSSLSEEESSAVEKQLCRGIHYGCHVHFTEGLLHNPLKINNQYRMNQLQFEKNRLYYGNHHWVIKRNIANLTQMLKRALQKREEDSYYRAKHGKITPVKMWKAIYTQDEYLFRKILKREEADFAVDILLDGSGSQLKRQTQIAAEGYMLSEALTKAGIPHRVSSFCTFWDYTILHSFRDFDSPQSHNMRIFEFKASANNRDGLAIKAVVSSLKKRPEKHKLLLILSDGCPNDSGRVLSGNGAANPYIGQNAIKDTALEIRRARTEGILVAGIFAGQEEELADEKKMFGRDFAYIRDIKAFSAAAGRFLIRMIDA